MTIKTLYLIFESIFHDNNDLKYQIFSINENTIKSIDNAITESKRCMLSSYNNSRWIMYSKLTIAINNLQNI